MSAPEQGLVRLRDERGVGRIHLSDPGRRNALSKEMSDEIAAAVATLLALDVGAIIVSAVPPAFCSGGSLDDLMSGAHPLRDLYAWQDAITTAPVPTIAAIRGAAIGAGVSLALACDVAIVTPAARFDPRFLDLGLHPGGGQLWRLRNRVGDQAAAAMVLGGDVLVGDEAVTAGLAWKCVAEDDLEEVAMRLARRAADRPPDLVRRTKQTLKAVAGMVDGEQAASIEFAAQEWSAEQPAFQQAVLRARTGSRPSRKQ